MDLHTAQTIDSLFAHVFFAAALIGFGYFIFTMVNLPKYGDPQTLEGCIISRAHITALFILAMIPAMYFFLHQMPKSGATTILMALVLSYSIDRLSNRARVLLRHYNYI